MSISDDNMSDRVDGEGSEGQYHLEKIQGMLMDLKSCLDLPVNFKPRIPEQSHQRHGTSNSNKYD